MTYALIFFIITSYQVFLTKDWQSGPRICILYIYKEFFKILFAEGWMESNIAIALKPFKVQPSLTHAFTDEQLHHLLMQPNRATFTGLRNYVMMLTLLDTGIRLKELAGIQIQDMLFDEGVLRVQQGKGRKFRLVPIQHVLAETLKRYLLERGTLVELKQ
ncbi:tyrosine-type recombinase/integrase [Brevibacillus sp. B_LB10_24]|uniref:tyrosine-type recombinase/integrase n=1 Tax=Brevibacillus sp. B_LB10_24 TaxID=3380645 RepID=UPI0038BADACC